MAEEDGRNTACRHPGAGVAAPGGAAGPRSAGCRPPAAEPLPRGTGRLRGRPADGPDPLPPAGLPRHRGGAGAYRARGDRGRAAGRAARPAGARTRRSAPNASCRCGPKTLFDVLEPGATLAVDEAMLRVAVVEEGRATAIVVAGGRVRSNRAVVIDPAPALPALTEKDRTAVDIAVAAGVGYFALGYAASARRGRGTAGAPAGRRPADRPHRQPERGRAAGGDHRRRRHRCCRPAHLAAELPIEQVPFLQKAIAREGVCRRHPRLGHHRAVGRLPPARPPPWPRRTTSSTCCSTACRASS